MNRDSLSFPIILVISLLACILRLYNLDGQSVWFEELETLNQASWGGNVWEFLRLYYQNPDVLPPAHLLLTRLMLWMFGEADFWLKIPAVIFGVGSVVLVMLLGQRLLNRRVALITGLMMCFSGANIYYSQEVRYNTMLVFFCRLFFYQLYHLLKGESKKWPQYVGLILSGVVLVHIHYIAFAYMGLVLLGFSLLFCQNYRQRLGLLGILLLLALVYLPWLQIASSQFANFTIDRSYNMHPNLWAYFYKMLAFTFSYETYWNLKTTVMRSSTVQLLTFIVIHLIVLGGLIFRFKNFRYRPEWVMALVIVIVPVVAIYAVDMVRENKIFYEKILLFTLPFSYLLLAWFMDSFYQKSFWVKGFSALVLGLLIFQTLINCNYYGQKFKTDFRGLTAKIQAGSEFHEVIPLCGQKHWYDYYRRAFKVRNSYNWSMLEEDDFSKREGLVKKLRQTRQGKTVWVINAHCSIDKKMREALRPYKVIGGFTSQTAARGALLQLHR